MHVPADRSPAVRADDEGERRDTPPRVRRVIASGASAVAASTAASLFGSAGGRIQRSTVVAVPSEVVAPARIALTTAGDATTIRRQRGTRERDRSKGREKQRRTQARDRKQRGEDRTAEVEAEEEEAVEAGRAWRWENARQQRRGEARQTRDEQVRQMQQEFDEAERREAEEQAAAEEEERQEQEDRKRQEAEERERQERERQDREAEKERQRQAEQLRQAEEERKQQEAEAAAERERVEEADRRQRKEAADKAEAERKRLEDATSTDFEPENITPKQFEERCSRLFDQARAQSVVYRAADDAVKSAVKFAKGTDPPRSTMYGPRVVAARVELRKVRAALAAPRVDPLAAARGTAIDRAKATKAAAKAIPGGPKGSPEGELRGRLVKEATVLAIAAPKPHMTVTQHDITQLQADADSLHARIDQALVDLPLFPVMHGAADVRQRDLKSLRGQLADAEITTLMGLVNNLAVADQAAVLLDLTVVSKAVPTIGVVGLTTLLGAPACHVLQLANAIALGGQMGLAVPACVANLGVLQTVASTFGRNELAWFANIAVPALTALDGQFGPRLVTFCRAITRARYDHMIHHNVPLARIDHYFTLDPAFLMGWGVNDAMWAHITKIYLNPNTQQISGGHDKAQFDVFYGNLLVDGWTEHTPINRLPRASPAGTELVTYDLRTPGGFAYTGTKTLITGLNANPLVWKPLIDNAAWNAMATVAIGPLFWTGSDGTDNWTGIYNGTSIDTAYLT